MTQARKITGEICEKIKFFIGAKVHDSGCGGAVIGLSGGVDSAVVAALAVWALDKHNVLGLIIPCDSNPDDEKHAWKLARGLGISVAYQDISATHKSLVGLTVPGYRTDLAGANLKSRLRMSVLYYYANSLNYLVLGTSNKTEMELGYFTKYGDGGVDIEPLGSLYKTEIWALARKIEVPQEIINKKPSAGLWEGQTDESEIGFSYENLDVALRAIASGEADGQDSDVLAKVRNMQAKAAHKLSMPPICKLS